MERDGPKIGRVRAERLGVNWALTVRSNLLSLTSSPSPSPIKIGLYESKSAVSTFETESVYGIQHVNELKINQNNSTLSTTLSFNFVLTR